MFEHFSFRVPRYGEDAVRKNPLNRKVKIICNPEFEELFNSLFSGVDFGKAVDRHEEEPLYSSRVSISDVDDGDSMVAPNKTPGKPFKWRTDDDDVEDEDEVEDDEEPYIHEPDVVYADEDEDEDESAKEPPSIFDMLNSGKNFGDIVSAKPKHTDIYNQAFGLDDDGNEIEPPDDAVETEAKNPFVFIANRLTFLAQTVQPIIFDTSMIETGSDYIKIALNEDKTFPKIRSFDELGLITCKLNCCQTIRDEIGEFIKGTEYTDIFCFPEFMSKDGPGTDVWAIKFICYKRK